MIIGCLEGVNATLFIPLCHVHSLVCIYNAFVHTTTRGTFDNNLKRDGKRMTEMFFVMISPLQATTTTKRTGQLTRRTKVFRLVHISRIYFV